MGKQRKSAYAEEFRKEAVRLSQLPDRTATQVTKQLGVNAQQIANWKRQFTRLSDKQFNALEGIDYSKQETKEMQQLKLENMRLKEELEFLKKVSAYFAKRQE